MHELATLLDEATGALARMDAQALADLGERTLELRTLTDVQGVPAEVMARFRVFSGVLRETERGLGILRRLQAEATAGDGTWVR